MSIRYYLAKNPHETCTRPFAANPGSVKDAYSKAMQVNVLVKGIGKVLGRPRFSSCVLVAIRLRIRFRWRPGSKTLILSLSISPHNGLSIKPHKTRIRIYQEPHETPHKTPLNFHSNSPCRLLQQDFVYQDMYQVSGCKRRPHYQRYYFPEQCITSDLREFVRTYIIPTPRACGVEVIGALAATT